MVIELFSKKNYAAVSQTIFFAKKIFENGIINGNREFYKLKSQCGSVREVFWFVSITS